MAKYIDREALAMGVLGLTIVDPMVAQYADAVLLQIQQATAADVEVVKHGHWIEQNISGEQAWCCSECKTLGSPYWKRCPVCEAKMDGGKGNG